MEARGFEPLTFRMRTERSPSELRPRKVVLKGD